MFLIVGLGNPGPEYARTRHNLGFMLVDKLAADAAVNVRRSECQSFVGSGLIENQRVKLAKPQTFMNLSGDAVSCLISKPELDAATLIVISDDLALPFGAIRVRQRGSSAGHQGVESIIGALGTQEFLRLRLGVAPERKVPDGARYVLSQFRKSQLAAVDKLLDTAADAMEVVLKDGAAAAMNRFNRKGESAED